LNKDREVDYTLLNLSCCWTGQSCCPPVTHLHSFALVPLLHSQKNQILQPHSSTPSTRQRNHLSAAPT